MDGLFTNTSKRQDFFKRVFDERSGKPCHIKIAVAFLTDAAPILELAQGGAHVQVIVRMGYPTKPAALRALLNRERVRVKYINNRSFHPKLYIFGGWGAVVGSSNLTQSALSTNQEVNVVVGTEDPRYDELLALFAEYWGDVRVLDGPAVDEYEKIYEKHRRTVNDLGQMEEELQSLRQTAIGNVRRDLARREDRDIFLEEYKATYQGFLDAFRAVEAAYLATGQRKVEHDEVPLRIEIDSFLSWVRDDHAQGESYKTAPLLTGTALESKTNELIAEWFTVYYKWFHEKVLTHNYPTIVKAFESPAAIRDASYEQILDALSCENSFYDRFRFFGGGHETHVKAFRDSNPLERVKKTLTYLVFGPDDHVERMGRCIFDPEYKLNEFGRSAVQELLGWVNNENIPICNSRTLRSLRWMGYDVELVGG